MTRKVIGPEVRWVNPFRIRTGKTDGKWFASYRLRDGSARVSGCESKADAVRQLRHFLTMRVVPDGTGFRELA